MIRKTRLISRDLLIGFGAILMACHFATSHLVAQDTSDAAPSGASSDTVTTPQAAVEPSGNASHDLWFGGNAGGPRDLIYDSTGRFVFMQLTKKF